MVAADIGMARQLTLQQRIFIVEQWLKHDKNPTATAAAFSQEFPNDVPPSRQSVHPVAKSFTRLALQLTRKEVGALRMRITMKIKKMFGLSIRMRHQHLQFVQVCSCIYLAQVYVE